MASEMAITSELDLSSFKAMGAAKSRRVTINPENTSSFTSTSSTTDVYFTLPSGKFSFINGQNSYLAFDLTGDVRIPSAVTLGTAGTAYVAGATTLRIANGSASSFIRTLEVQMQSQSVELLDKYDVFAAIVEDAQGLSRASSVASVTMGAAPPATAAASLSTGLKSATGLTYKCGADLFNGQNSPAASTAAWTAGGVTLRVCIPLYSSTLGTMAQQHLPAADGIRLRLAFQPSEIPMVLRTAATITAATAGAIIPFDVRYNVSNMALQMDYLDVVPEVYMQLVSEAGGVLRQHGTAVANFGTTISAASTFASLLVPARYSSLKSYMTCFRASATTTSLYANSCGDRLYPAMNDYVYRIDGKNYPSVPVRCGNAGTATCGESMMEVIKCFHALHSTQFDLVFNFGDYGLRTITSGTGVSAAPYPTPADATAGGNLGNICGSFLIGLDFEQDSAGKVVISGLDTNSSNTYLDINSSGVAVNLVADTFGLYDLIVEYSVSDGVVSFSK